MSALKMLEKIINTITHNQFDQLSEQSLLEAIPNWDSLTALQVMTSIEKMCDVKLPIYKFMETKTIGDILSLINK